MKKLLVGLFALIAGASFGQVRRGNNVVLQTQFGVFGGLSVADQWYGDSYDGFSQKAKAGGIAGVQLALPISYGWYVQPEVTYTNMGSRYFSAAQSSGDFQGNVNSNANYLNVPILFKYEEPFTGFGVFFGPQYSYLLNAKDKPTGPDKNNYTSTDLTDYYHRSDLGAVVGLEYYFPNDGRPGPQFGFSARYQFGFLNINNGAQEFSNGNGSYTPTIRNEGFFLTAGVRF